MTASEQSDLYMNIESLANEVASERGPETVRDIFSMYGASGVDDLPEDAYEQVFSELIRLSAD